MKSIFYFLKPIFSLGVLSSFVIFALFLIQYNDQNFLYAGYAIYKLLGIELNLLQTKWVCWIFVIIGFLGSLIKIIQTFQKPFIKS